MERARRVQDVWGWLPAFRAVAETQHLPTAAKRLHVTPSALSRSVRLLEEELGRPLFHRVGRGLQLSDAGEAFLAAVRDAMRLVDDGMATVSERRLVGALTVAAPDAVMPAVLDVAEALAAAHEGLVIRVRQVAAAVVPAQLLSGQLDAAIVDATVEAPRLTREPLGAVAAALYVGPGHPLHGRAPLSLEDVLAYPFVALDAAVDVARGTAAEPWPPHLERTVTLYVDRAGIAEAVCARGSHVAVLPDGLARAALYRLPLEQQPSQALCLLRRPTLTPDGKAEVFTRALRLRLEAAAP